ncbi:lasso peptide biosynthesis B2 protein [Streptomyces roseifaciens]
MVLLDEVTGRYWQLNGTATLILRPLPGGAPALMATAAARLLVTLKPHRIRRVLSLVRREAVPATVEQALTARRAVVAVSARCAGEGGLQRSVATALL